MDAPKYREAMKLMEDGQWFAIPFEQLCKGDRFRLFESQLILEGVVENDPRPCDPPGNYEMLVTKHG